jgi:hypothetical protein
MNLGKLLGAGKSFVNGGKPAAYRTDKRVYLPQFVSPKNPFANSATPPTQAELPKRTAQNPAAAMEKFTPPPAGPVRTTTWASRLNPALIFRVAPPSAGNAAPPLQAELSLEKVKVVHNDLADAEVEVVPMKSRPARAAATDSKPAKKSWSDLGERILKATAL